MAKRKPKREIVCVYKIVCTEDKAQKCPCKLAGTKKVQVVFDSMNRLK